MYGPHAWEPSPEQMAVLAGAEQGRREVPGSARRARAASYRRGVSRPAASLAARPRPGRHGRTAGTATVEPRPRR